jgi:hypothetical protein
VSSSGSSHGCSDTPGIWTRRFFKIHKTTSRFGLRHGPARPPGPAKSHSPLRWRSQEAAGNAAPTGQRRHSISNYPPMTIEFQPPPEAELNEMSDGSHL